MICWICQRYGRWSAENAANMADDLLNLLWQIWQIWSSWQMIWLSNSSSRLSPMTNLLPPFQFPISSKFNHSTRENFWFSILAIFCLSRRPSIESWKRSQVHFLFVVKWSHTKNVPEIIRWMARQIISSTRQPVAWKTFRQQNDPEAIGNLRGWKFNWKSVFSVSARQQFFSLATDCSNFLVQLQLKCLCCGSNEFVVFGCRRACFSI